MVTEKVQNIKKIEELRRLESLSKAKGSSAKIDDPTQLAKKMEDEKDFQEFPFLESAIDIPEPDMASKADKTKAEITENIGPLRDSVLDSATHSRRLKVFKATQEFESLLKYTETFIKIYTTVFYISGVLGFMGLFMLFLARAPLTNYGLIISVIGFSAHGLAFFQLMSQEKQLKDSSEITIDGYDYVLAEEWTQDNLRLLARSLALQLDKKGKK